MKFDDVISVCASKDIETWKISSKHIIKFINSLSYTVIVPDDQINLFRSASPSQYNVVGENKYTKVLLPILIQHVGSNYRRINWYIQQFLKLYALNDIGENNIALIWDADTVPLRQIKFEDHGKIVFYKGDEYHAPYFNTINNLLNLEKRNNHSYIAQCFPCKGKWIKEMINLIESNGTNWDQSIINSIDFREESGFSEFETLGTFIEANFINEIQISNQKWTRYGNSLIGSISNLKFFSKLLSVRYVFISFENWDKPFSSYKRILNRLFKEVFK